MPPYGVAVEKEMLFRGGPERFSNIYHYAITAPVEGDYENLAEAVIERDRAAHQGSITYRAVRVFGPTDQGPAASAMRYVADLSGGGTRAPLGANVYPELCATVSAYLGRSDTTGRKIFLRKFIHLVTLQSSGSSASTGLLATAEQDFWETWFEACFSVTRNAVTYDMVSPRNRPIPGGTQADCLTYAHIRQLHQ